MEPSYEGDLSFSPSTIDIKPGICSSVKMDLKRKRPTVLQKLNALERLENGEQLTSVAADLNVSERSVFNWKKQKMQLEGVLKDSITSNLVADVSRTKIKINEITEVLRERVYRWFVDQRNKGVTLTQALVSAKAVDINKELGGPPDFAASQGWIYRFKKAYGIHLTMVNGEVRSADNEAAETYRSLYSFKEPGRCSDDQPVHVQINECRGGRDEVNMSSEEPPDRGDDSESSNDDPLSSDGAFDKSCYKFDSNGDTDNGEYDNDIEKPVKEEEEDALNEIVKLEEEPSVNVDLRGCSETAEEPHVCTTCNAKFSLKTHLTAHMRTHSEKRPFVCTICDAEFTQRAHLTSHIRTHTGEKPYICATCNAQFSHKHNLTNHIRTHTGEKPHVCTTCNAQFAVKARLISHVRTHTGEKPYVCMTCSAQFSRRDLLTAHIRTHTGEKFICTTCNAQFSRPATLMSHMRTHTKEEPFVCPTCNAQFSQKPHLTKHLRTYSREKPYVCPKCKARFCQKSKFMTHLYTHQIKQPNFARHATSSSIIGENVSQTCGITVERSPSPALKEDMESCQLEPLAAIWIKEEPRDRGDDSESSNGDPLSSDGAFDKSCYEFDTNSGTDNGDFNNDIEKPVKEEEVDTLNGIVKLEEDSIGVKSWEFSH